MNQIIRKIVALLAVATSATTLFGSTLYVTPTGAGNQDGSSWANAYAGIQAAVDAVDAAVAADANYPIPTIHVADGTYTRVAVSRDMALDVRSENGAASTIIDGFNTNRCVLCYANGFKTTPTFTGFTLRNGNVTGFSNTDSYGGGAGGGTLVDCVIEDCSAVWGGGTYRANTQRCIIRRCRATGAGGACAEEGTHRNTLMCQSTGTSYITYGVYLYNCTVADNTATSDDAIHTRNQGLHNCILWGNAVYGQPYAQNDDQDQDPKFVGGDDYRLRVGSPMIDNGDATYATEQYVGTTDLAGNARVQGNAIDRGCYEGPGVEGCRVTAIVGGNGVVSPTSFFTNETMSVTITADTSVYNRPVTAWYTNGVLAASGGNSLTVVMSGNGDIEVTAMFATYEWFVNGTTGSDSNDGRTAATAFKTIAKAVSSAANDETINVAAGTYAPIDTTGKRINIVGTAGAAATIIDGGDTQRCALLSDGTTLTGFTLQHGRSITSDDMQGGGGAMGGTLVACVLKDNIASYGGGALGSTLIRCTVTDNSAAFGGGVHRCKAYNSLIAYNSATEGGGARFGELRGCTVVYNRGCLSGGIEYAMVLNSILRYNRTANGRPSYNIWNYEGNCIDEPNANDEDGEWLDGYTIVEDPLFVDPENGDFRLLAGSPCINYGDVNFYYIDDGLDLAGNARIVGDDPDLGCYEGEVEGYVVSVRVDGHGSVSARTIVVAEGGSATITATADGRAFQRWLVDGEIAGTSTTLTLSNIDEDHVVTACFQRNTTTVSGSSDALQTAINAAKDGDTLVVSPGTYSAIVATNRVLDIKSSAGPETTIIQGTNNGLLSGTRAATFSLTVTRPTCTLSGFTLTGGFCGDPIYGGGGVFGGIVSNCVIRGNGALIGGGAAYSMLSHCVISNNTAYVLGGGAAFLALDNCLVTGNEVQFNTIEWIRRLAATLGINLNIPADFGGGAGVAYAAADHCTITKNTSTAAEAGGGFWVVLDNSIVAGNTATAEGAPQNISRTPVIPLYTCTTYDHEFWGEIDPPGFVNATLDDTFVDAAAGDFRLKATSACVDGCDSTFDLENPDMERIALWLGATDLTGSPRWLALAPDIGCYETTPAKPGAVPDVAATRSAYREDILVSWTGVKHGAWYTIHRGPWNNGAGTFAQAEQIGVVTNVFTSFLDDTAEASVDYRYWVVAHSGAGSGPYGADDRGYWIAPLVITTESLPDGTVREPWTAQLAATGGIGTYTWEVTQPDWLSFSGATLSGVPRVQGDIWVVVTVTDQSGQEAEKAFQISIAKNPNPQNITISNLAEFRAFMEDVHTYYFEGDTVTLTADIDCEGGRFTTGASGSGAYSCFKGTFDGRGHVISNFLNKALSAGTGNTSTFGVAMFDIARDGAVIKNLTLQGDFGNGAATPDYAAAFAGYAIGHTNGTLGLTLENCHFIGSVTNYKCSAAFVGAALHGSGAPDGRVLYMTNCTARGSIVSTYIYVTGGLVASGEGVEAYDCSMEGEVLGCWTLGGLIGQAFDSSFARCSFAGPLGPGPDSINGSDGGCGGLVGFASNAVFRACTANADIDWNISSGYNAGKGRIDSRNFIGEGGAAGVTCGSSAFYDCTAAGTLKAKNGYGGGFVGWTAGAEVFSNCTTTVTLQPDARYVNTIGHGGFASSVASAGALFVDCSVSPRGNNIFGGFYNNQHPRKGVAVGTNTFRRCTVENPALGTDDVTYGFASACWNGVFEGCTVRGGRAGTAGFVGSAGKRPDDNNYDYAQTSTFTDCAVVGSRASVGFVQSANYDGKAGSTNVFRRCRASGVFGGWRNGAFAGTLNRFSLAEDCVGYGVSDGDEGNGFAGVVSTGATVRRCVGALLPFPSQAAGSGFADTISYDSVVEDCYSVYAPTLIPRYAGQQAGFVLETSLGISHSSVTSSGTDKLARCFALGVIPGPTLSGNGSFCGGTPEYPRGATYDVRFEDCYRPAESPVADFDGQDHAGVGVLTKAQFASATAATMQNYDFQHVWHAPRGVASSPYLAASTDGGTNFWFAAAVVSGEGSILVNGEAPRDSYPIGATITVRAVPVNPDQPFIGWVGEGFADPLAQETTYTVRNVSAIGATFGTPIRTVEDFLAIPDNASDAYVLMNDLDFTEFLSTNTYFSEMSVDNFQGKFFGQGHTIRYACSNSRSTSEAAAPFSSLSAGAQLRDLTVESVVTNCYGHVAGLVSSIGNGVLVSNCHARLVSEATPVSSGYYGHHFGFAKDIGGTDIRIVDCTVEMKSFANSKAAGFADSISMTGGEISRCAVFAEMTATNSTSTGYGRVAGFANYIYLYGGATMRECLAAGVADGAGETAGFVYEIQLDAESSIRDCYSTMEVVSRGNSAAGFAYRLSDNSYNYEAGVSNLWFGGSVRSRPDSTAYGFAYYMSYVNLVNCYWVSCADAPASGADGVTALAPAAARQHASWTGYDFANTWSLIEGSTTPYFAWSLTTNGSFRVIAAEEPGTTIVCGDAAPGSNAVISASADNPGWFFDSWKGVVDFADAGANPTTFLADNHRAVRCAWVKEITTRAELAAIASDPAGIYVLGCDIDLAGAPWTPLCQGEYTQFTGTLYGNGHTISNLVVDTDRYNYAGLFGRLGKGATVTGVKLVNPVVSGGGYTGAFAGCVNAGANVSQCAVIGGRVTATGDYSGVFAGYVGGGSVSECFAVGSVTSTYGYVGGFAGYMDGATLSDCYAVAAAKGGSYVGSFAGQIYGSGTSLARCYAAGTASGSSDAGGFAGYRSSSPVLTDCFAQNPAAATAGVTALDAAGMRTRANFAAFHATGKWAQTDGVTQPYFSWSMVDGKFLLAGDASTVTGLGAYAPGAQAPISANTQGRFFVSWTGGATYADATASSTTVLVDNFRAVDYLAGVFISTRAELADIANNPAGIYGLAADIDLSGSPWTPIGDYYTPFTGMLYGNGHTISNLVVDTDGYDYAGLFGRLGKGATVTGVKLVNPVVSGGGYTGAFAGCVNAGANVSQCAVIGGRVTATRDYSGVFAGYVDGGSVSECVAVGSVASTYGYVGGFAGYMNGATLSDCYAVAAAKGGSYVGSFAGQIYGSGTSLARCYAAGTASGSSNAGGFAGSLSSSPVLTDCFAQNPAAATAGVTALDAAGMRTRANFAAFHATGKWTQTDGVTQPYFSWGLVDGKFLLSGDAATVTGLGAYAPGAQAPISADTQGRFFISWTGGATYADATATSTTVLLDNFRFVDFLAGVSISTRAELADIANNPSGIYGLAADIDLGGTPWTPLGDGSTPFTGTLYGNGHTISNLAVSLGSSDYAGLFGYLGSGATVTGVRIANANVGGGSYVGALAGRATGATVRDCSVVGATVAACGGSDGGRAGGLIGHAESGTTVSRCFAIADVSATTDYIGGLIGVIYSGSASCAVSECFSVGSVSSTATCVGGFAGWAGGGYGVAVSDCYTVASAHGSDKVGGFYGMAERDCTVFTRCYAAGGDTTGNSNVGAFAGYLDTYWNRPLYADCFRLADGLPDIGSVGDHADIAALGAAGMRTRANFAAFHAAGVWSQTDGLTQPYFSWGLVDGKFLLSGDAAAVNGLGAYAPGAQAPISANTQGFFIGWTGGATYADATATSTTVLLDNFRSVDYLSGVSIATRAELAAIANDPAGTYGLAADIDLGGADWTPLGDGSTPFSGKLYGRGHAISNLTVNLGGTAYAGLFGCIGGGTVSDIRLVNPVVRGGTYTGTLVGRMTGASTVSGCSAIGATVEGGERTGGLVGDMQDSSTLARSFFLGDVTATGQYIGGLVGVVYKSGSSVSECFACGTVSSTSGYVGGLVGWVGDGPSISDCYALERVRGTDRVGGFVGHAETSSTSFRRCYAAGGDTDGSSNVGGFVGYRYSSPAFSDCIVLGDAGGVAGIASLDRAGMLQRSNFASYHATGKWSQIDGRTQPYFDWGLVDGCFLLGGDATDINGLGAYAPGTSAAVSVNAAGRIFLGWTGNATYADSSSPSTTVLVDNYRAVSAEFGSLITTRAELEAVANDLAGSYALGADIDLSGSAWTPLGATSSTPFTGSLYGHGHKITGLTFSNTSSGDSNGSHAGLFRYASGATFDGIHLEGVSIRGYQYTGALAGEVQGATAVRNCSAQGVVTNSNGYAGLLVGQVYGSGTSFENCAATGTVYSSSTSSSDCGGLVGRVYYSPASFTDCDANVEVTGTGGSNKGGLIGSVKDGSAGATFTRCTAEGSVASSNSDSVGGFLGYANKAVSCTDCSATGTVTGKNGTGGFAGSIDSVAHSFTRCVATGDASGTQNVGGFVGSTTGGNTQFVECEAQGKATGSSGSHAGGFAGQTTGTGTRFARCTAMGDASAPSEQVGGFAGYLNNSNDVWRCRSFGSASGTYRVGGFVGYLYSGNTAIRESFAIGDAAATRTTDEALAGGFAGQVNTSARLSDCYAIGVASGGYCVGGFAGKFVNSSISVTRCYAAGGIECAGTYGGAFVGNSGQYGTLADCAAVLAGGVHAVGTSTAGTTATLAAVSELTAAEFRQTANFQAFHESGLWSQKDGFTQPYLAWGLVDGKMSLAGKSVGALGGSISGLGFYEPGDTVTIRAVTTGNAVFLGWTGNAPYANPDAAQTTLVLDNFRCVVASFGTSITTAADLAGIANKLDGSYALGADIDLSVSAWTPLGATSSTPFTGTLKGNGHVITGLAYSNISSGDANGDHAGLFRYVKGATLENIHLEGVSLTGYRYVGALAGEVQGATTIRNCSVEGTVASTNEQVGLLVGRVTGAGTTFSNCAATGAVVSASSNVGGLVGYANVAVTFEDCDAAVFVSGKGNAVGGFIGKTDTAAATFRRCSASGDVSNTSDTTGGFVGQSGAAGTVFENCVAEGAVSGTSSVGGFVGSTTGGNTQFVECDALGTVKGSSYYAGGFVGQTTANGIRYALCRALGGVSSTSYNVGGFVGYISNSNDVWRCMSAGSASGTYDVGGFVGNFDGANTAIRECFALGDATSTRTGNYDGIAGGFAGRIGSTNPKISDSYCLGAVSAATRIAGGFAGKFDSASISLTRCYAAGTVECPGTYVGAFVGTTNTYAAVLSDCAVLCDAIHGVGLSTAGTNDTLANVAEYNEAGMKNAANFATWLALRGDGNVAVWVQSDGFSQPVLAWSAPGGKLTIYESIGGSARGYVNGAYDWYDPGTVVEIAAVSDEGFFLDWTGSTPYADPTASPTTIPLDNHRVAAVRFGRFIHDADELDAVRNDLAGYYGLANDIDLTGRDWTPIGFNNDKFTGTFYGFGYEVKHMVCTNSPATTRHGLFGWAVGATLDGIKVSGVVQSTSESIGGLVGVADATIIRDCHADVDITTTGRYAGGLVGSIGAGTTIIGCSSKGSVTSTSDYAGGFAGNGGGGNFEIRDCVAAAETVGSTYVGGFIGYVTGGDTVISGCRADGYACCTSQSVGGFIGGVNSSLTISNCVARGDVRCKKGATYAGYGGFVGYMNGSSTVIADSWCSGAVWGQGANCGAFVGYSRYGTVRNCSIYAFGAGPRPFSGSDGNLNGGSLTASQIELLSKDENGDPWPTVKNHAHSATKIRTVEDLFAVTNNLDGIYALANDIDLGGAAWTPIGNASAGFTGEFYGENHCISNFVVNSSVSGAGLFGCIAGGRVNGVRAYGSVTGSNEQVGGFVGRLAQMSLVDGCSFSGTVSGSQYVVGGFAGRICDSPVVLRSCAVNCTVTFTGEGGSYKSAYAGGFVGAHDNGYVMDCYAVADVSSVNQARYVGGFVGNVSSGQITTSWCAGSAETTGSYLGAFAGYAQSGYITKSYYDSGKTSYLAMNNAAYDGITPLTSAQMLHPENFNGFDFMATWRIDEGETTPYLRSFIVQLTGFTAWLDEYKLPPDTDPLTVTNGIPLIARYVYGIVPMTATTDINGRPLVDIKIDANGTPRFDLAPQKNADDYGLKFSVIWSRNLSPWQTLGEIRFDADGDGNDNVCHPPVNTSTEPRMFFKYRLVLENE